MLLVVPSNVAAAVVLSPPSPPTNTVAVLTISGFLTAPSTAILNNTHKKLRKHFVTFFGLLTYNYIQELFTIKTQGEDR